MKDFIFQHLLSSMNDCCYTYEVIYISVQCNTVQVFSLPGVPLFCGKKTDHFSLLLRGMTVNVLLLAVGCLSSLLKLTSTQDATIIQAKAKG